MMHSMMANNNGGDGTGSNNCDLNPTFNPDAPWCLSNEDLPNCTLLNGCPAKRVATYVYFYSFTLLVSYIVVNLFVAAVLESFENSKEGDILCSEDLDSFIRLWSLYDESATWYIDAVQVKELISRLEEPLGFGSQAVNASRDDQNVKDVESLMQESGLADIPVNKDGKCNIVPIACMVAKLKQGENFSDLSQSNPVQQKLSIHNQNGRPLGETVFFCTLPSTKLRALQPFARTYRHKRQQNKKASKIVPIAIRDDEPRARGG